MNNDLKKTPLSQWHAENGGKMVEYAGFEMPVQYRRWTDANTAIEYVVMNLMFGAIAVDTSAAQVINAA